MRTSPSGPGVDRGFSAESYLDSLDLFGWRFGLERMHRLTALLGMPQHRFASIHVVGTNGKSSVAQMAAAVLEAHGVSAGAYLSPHLSRWSERILIRGEEIGPGEFASAAERVAEAARLVNRSLATEDRSDPDPGEGAGATAAGSEDVVTQFEAMTAIAFVAMAAARVEAGVIEAGLGGRLDATNVIPSKVSVLTSVGLDHTEWLGETLPEIATEKLAVLGDSSTLVIGKVPAEIADLARRTASERGARLIVAPDEPDPALRLRARGPYQRRNFALAVSATEAFLGRLSPEVVRGVAETLQIPGRLEVVPGDPPLIFDAAHNADGAAALAEALGEMGERPVALLAVLEEKDAAGIVGQLVPALERAIFTEIPGQALAHSARANARSAPAAELAELAGRRGAPSDAVPSFEEAFELARGLARESGCPLLISGSHYTLAAARLLWGPAEG